MLAGEDGVFSPLNLLNPSSAWHHAQSTVRTNAHLKTNFPGLTCWAERSLGTDLVAPLPQLRHWPQGRRSHVRVGISRGDEIPDSPISLEPTSEQGRV